MRRIATPASDCEAPARIARLRTGSVCQPRFQARSSGSRSGAGATAAMWRPLPARAPGRC
eukprot:15445951-Alexandrium_andersonii.AAC.1